MTAAEEALKALIAEASTSREILYRIIDSVGDPLFVKDEQHRWIVLNKACCAFIGHPREALLGKSDFEFFPEEEARVFWEKDEEVLRTGAENVNEERFTDAAGVTHIISTKKTAFTDEKGRRFLVGVIRDVTEIKRAEEALRAQAQELARAKEAAEAGARAKTRFLASVSHELRTPMNAVIALTALLEEERLGPSEREKIELIRQSGEALLVLIDDILDYAKTESDRLEVEEKPFSLSACLFGARSLIEPKARKKGLSLELVLEEGAPRCVVGDMARTRQVLANLLDNAVKFTDAGGVEIRVDAPREERGERTFRISVRDTGKGIPAARKSELFLPFSQLDANETGPRGGAGLGLAISKQLVDRMGGRIGVDDAPGGGALFWFELPARPADLVPEETEPAEPVPADLGRTHPLRVLVAEDNPVNRRVALLLLERLGYEADVVETGREVIRALGERVYDVVLMDMQMPEMSGLDATRAIRAELAEERRPRIVALTASAMPSEREACLAAGMDDYLAKPVRIETLRRALERTPRLRA